jgi:Cu/Ag efflux protein CusF
MTMAYQAQGPRQVRQIKVGSKVRFEAEQASSDHTDTKMQK